MAWYDDNYGYKKKITIDHTKVSGDEVDFPVLVSVTDANLRDEANGGNVKNSDGYDIIFTNSAENTQLKHEIEKYTNTSGLLVFWVKVPALSSVADTDIYIYYGKAGVGVDPSTTDTWDSDFEAVYHMNEAAGNLVDSTANANSGTAVGTPTYSQTGKIGDCITFSGDDYFTGVLPQADVPIDDGVFEFWCKNGITVGLDIMIGWVYAGNNRLFLGINTATSEWYTGWGSTYTKWGTTDTNWHFHTYRAGAGHTLKGYIDSATPPGLDVNSNAFTRQDDLLIGTGVAIDATRAYVGDIEEVRISGSLRSENWMETTFETQNDPAGFMSFGSEEGRTTAPCRGKYFSLHGTATTILFPYPEWGTPSNRVDKTVDLLDFWDDDLDTIDRGINTQPLTLAGTVCKCGTGVWENYAEVGVWLDSIKTAMNDGEEFEINELGDCINGVYIVKDFTFNTIKKYPNCYEWNLSLERVRDI